LYVQVFLASLTRIWLQRAGYAVIFFEQSPPRSPRYLDPVRNFGHDLPIWSSHMELSPDWLCEQRGQLSLIAAQSDADARGLTPTVRAFYAIALNGITHYL